jgi:hypothetical protein
MWRNRADGRQPSARCHGEPYGSGEAADVGTVADLGGRDTPVGYGSVRWAGRPHGGHRNRWRDGRSGLNLAPYPHTPLRF